MSSSLTFRTRYLLVALLLIGGVILIDAAPTLAACPGGAEDTWSDDADNGALTLNGIAGQKTLSHTKDSNHNSTCADLNVGWVQFTDEYAAQYKSGAVWITGSAGVNTLSGSADHRRQMRRLFFL